MWCGMMNLLIVFCPQEESGKLSPYLFVFCIERPAQCIEVAISAGLWQHIYLTKNGTSISHFAFADYFISFAKTSLDQVSIIRFADYLSIINYCLETFCLCSGKKVNKSKSGIFFFKICASHWRKGD